MEKYFTIGVHKLCVKRIRHLGKNVKLEKEIHVCKVHCKIVFIFAITLEGNEKKFSYSR